MKLLSVVGARPNFMKIAPFCAAVAAHNDRHPDAPVRHVLVHSGQHYDASLSERFFSELGIPAPDHHLGVGSGSHAYQVGTTMIEFEKVLLAEAPDWVIVAGDVNATCACSLTAKKHQFRVAHIEAGLRSDDWSMPEEINRVVTDRLSDLLLTTCRFANANLARECVPAEKIALVGNIMIDTLESHRARAASRGLDGIVHENRVADAPPARRALEREGFALLTLHRPSNVDEPQSLSQLLGLMEEFAAELPIVFPIHPRTAGRLKDFGLWARVAANERILAVQPLGYVDILALLMSARLVMTDSGGIQEECCVLGTPCLTLRANTERPATLVEHGGTNELVGADTARIRAAFRGAAAAPRQPFRPPLWDGHAAERILARLLSARERR